MAEERWAEFLKLFQEFAETYPKTPEGQSHIRHYEIEREEAKKNLETIIEAQNQGKDVTEEILLNCFLMLVLDQIKKRLVDLDCPNI